MHLDATDSSPHRSFSHPYGSCGFCVIMLLLSLVQHFHEAPQPSCVTHEKKCKAVPRLPLLSHPSCHSLLYSMQNRLWCCAASKTVVPRPNKSSKSQKKLNPRAKWSQQAVSQSEQMTEASVQFPSRLCSCSSENHHILTHRSQTARYSSPHLICFPEAAISYQLSLLDTS